MGCLSLLGSLKQGKIVRSVILGCIIAVCCVQISFQVYMAIDPSDADYRAVTESVRGVSVNGVPVAELPETNVDGPIPQPVLKQPQRLKAVVYRMPEISMAVARRKTSDRVPQLATVAVINKTPASAPTSTSNRVSVTTFIWREEPAKNRKPFIAKAFPVIKKPYDWIKALAIKLR